MGNKFYSEVHFDKHLYPWQAPGDFSVLKQKHQHYEDIFPNHEFFSHEKYEAKRNGIIKDWEGRPSQGGRTMDKDLETLYIQYEQIKGDHIVYVNIIHQMFDKIYGHYNDMVAGNYGGALSNAKFYEYLKEFEEAITTNQRLGLKCWDKPIAKRILENIAKLNMIEANATENKN